MTSARRLQPDQRSQVLLGGPDLGEPILLFETAQLLLEAPNWTLDGSALVLNGDGALWRLDLADRGLTRIDLDVPELNNDHVLDPDGEHVYASAMDGHVYRGRLDGGPTVRVTPEDGHWHFLHGVAPDGTRLAYVEMDDLHVPGRLAVLELGATVRHVEVGTGHVDGPEWSPDGAWIHLNTEAFTTAPGHAQLARVPDRGGTVERLVASETVDWFPHVSPDGAYATYVAFPPGTLGHPADVEVEVRLVRTADWSAPVQRYRIAGGQGTLNVPSWAPDSRRFAFVAYPAVGA